MITTIKELRELQDGLRRMIDGRSIDDSNKRDTRASKYKTVIVYDRGATGRLTMQDAEDIAMGIVEFLNDDSLSSLVIPDCVVIHVYDKDYNKLFELP